MSTTTAIKNTYRKTKTGAWVVYGPLADLKDRATVTVYKKDGTKKEETVERLGKPFTVDGVEMVYGYIADRCQANPVPRSHYSARRGRKACITGGNCSSFGDSRSCGGHDCDGY